MIDEAAVKSIRPAIRDVLGQFAHTSCDWKGAMTRFAVLDGGRFAPPRV
jgi:hypothetical protein